MVSTRTSHRVAPRRICSCLSRHQCCLFLISRRLCKSPRSQEGVQCKQAFARFIYLFFLYQQKNFGKTMMSGGRGKTSKTIPMILFHMRLHILFRWLSEVRSNPCPQSAGATRPNLAGCKNVEITASVRRGNVESTCSRSPDSSVRGAM